MNRQAEININLREKASISGERKKIRELYGEACVCM